jgi:hypothetical protein
MYLLKTERQTEKKWIGSKKDTVCVCGNLLVQEGEEDKKADSFKKNQKGTLLNKMCT